MRFVNELFKIAELFYFCTKKENIKEENEKICGKHPRILFLRAKNKRFRSGVKMLDISASKT